MDVIHQLKDVALKTFLGILRASADQDARFQTQLTVSVNSETKPVVLIGTAHRKIEDGWCAAVLNPDPDLRDELLQEQSALNHMKLLVAKRCDAAVNLWVDAYKPDPVSMGERYRASVSRPAKYAI